MSKSKLGQNILALSGVLVLVLAFQNCSQNGSINAASTGVSSKTSSGGDLTEEEIKDPIVKEDDKEDDDKKAGGCHAKHEGKCDEVEVEQVNIEIDKVVSQSGVAIFEVDSSKATLSSTQKTIKLKATADMKISEIRFVLKASGNSITSSNARYALKTPSAQQSGLKVKLSKEVEIKKDTMYELRVEMDVSKQIVTTKKQCIMKPVIKEGELI